MIARSGRGSNQDSTRVPFYLLVPVCGLLMAPFVGSSWPLLLAPNGGSHRSGLNNPAACRDTHRQTPTSPAFDNRDRSMD